MTDTTTIVDLLARAEHTAREHARILESIRSLLTNPDPDPLAPYRLPSGRIAYAEEAARWVQSGDWVQAVHGDADRWEQVTATVHADEQTGLTTRTADGTRTRLRWWGHDDKVRVATAPVPDPAAYREDLVDARHRAQTGGL